MTGPRVLDVTRPLGGATPVWPGDAPFRLRWTARLGAESPANVGELCCSTHCGTHLDAPYHVLETGRRVGAVPLDALMGPCVVVDARGRDRLDETLLAGVADRPERVLFRTGCWTRPDRFPERIPPLTPAAALGLARSGVRLVGTDAPSVDPYDSADLPAHRALAEAGVAILENLLLDHVPPGPYRLLALPLRLEDADASPVRALLLPPGSP